MDVGPETDQVHRPVYWAKEANTLAILPDEPLAEIKVICCVADAITGISP